jgi:hypothetical protein
VVGRRSRLTLVIVHHGHDASNAGADRLPVVVIIAVGRGRSPLRMFLMPPLAATWGRLPVSRRKTKFSCLAAVGILVGDAVHLLGGVPKTITMFALAWVSRAVFRSHACMPLVSLSVS